VAGGADYTAKPRPAVIVQDDRFDTDSITICPFTIDPTEAPLFRLAIFPSATNGLRETWRLMVDKITTMRRSRLGDQLGCSKMATWSDSTGPWSSSWASRRPASRRTSCTSRRRADAHSKGRFSRR